MGTNDNKPKESLPIMTNAAHCSRAISFTKEKNIFFGFGRTTPWDNELDNDFVAPDPSVNDTNLTELIAMRKTKRVVLVNPDDNGDIEYANILFKTVSVEEAKRLNSRWVLVETIIDYDELPPNGYRQIGVFSSVKPKTGKENKEVLLADEIEDVGFLEIINNRKVYNRVSGSKERFFMVLEL